MITIARGEVPVAAGEVVVDEAADHRHAVEGLLHRVRAERLGVEVDEGLLVELRAAGRHRDRVEDRRVLPGLAAVGDARSCRRP